MAVRVSNDLLLSRPRLVARQCLLKVLSSEEEKEEHVCELGHSYSIHNIHRLEYEEMQSLEKSHFFIVRSLQTTFSS